MDTRYILDIALILFLTKTLGLISKRIKLPQVVGALIAGVLLGPSGFKIIQMSDALAHLAEIGVILLMFNAGLETDIFALKKSIKSSTLISLGGMILSLILGYLFASYMGLGVFASIFIGVVLSATSMSITVETLQETNQIKSKSGTAILSASIIDDLLGILLLTLVLALSASDGDVSIGRSVLEVFKSFGLFFVFALVTGILASKYTKCLDKKGGHKHRISIFTLSYALFLAFMAEYFGIANITGAYLGGLFFANTDTGHYVERKTETLSYLFFSPIFFASIGIKATLDSKINLAFLSMIGVLFLVAFLGKIVGAGLGAKLAKFGTKDAIIVGTGMVARGEVSLIIADKGIHFGVIGEDMFSPIIIVVILTSLVTPILLTTLYAKKK